MMAQPNEDLDADDCLLPLTTIRDALIRPDSSLAHLDKLRKLLKWHSGRLRRPWEPFEAPSPASRAALNTSSLTIPHTSAQLGIDERSRTTALELSDRLGIDELECLLLVKSYDRHALRDFEDEQDGDVNRVALWYAEEAEAVPQIVLALYRLSRDRDEGWAEMVAEMRQVAVGDETKYVEGLFRAFGRMAQKQLEGMRRSENAILWAKHQLRLQDAFLQLLFLVQSTTTNRPAAVSEGLLKGAIMSSFGTDQANREIWEADLGDSEALRLETRIRDTMLVIALDSLCLSEIVAGVEGSEKPEGSLLRSRDKIIAVHLFMLDQSDDLAQNDIDQENTEYPVWPMPIVCLAWSIVLWSLPPDMLPPSPGFDRPIYQEFASRALQISSGLFPWLAEVLQGPLFEAGRHAVSDDLLDEGATSRSVVMKDLIMGLADMLQIDGINDRPGLIRTWELLFGVRSPSTSNALCSDFWVTDSPVVARQAILEKSLYPDDPTTLPRILAALAGPNHDASVGAGPPALPAVQVFEYFSNLRSITFSVKSSCYRFIGKDAQARMSVEATRELILPGGQIIARGTRGVILSNEDSAANMVSWRAQISGWGLLVEITRVCAGAQSDDGSALPSPATADSSVLSVRDLGVKGDLVEILMAGMKLLRTVLNPSSGVAAEVLKSVRDVETVTSHDDTSELVLLKLVLFVLERPRQSEVTGVQSEMATLAIEILQALIPASSPHLCSALWSACPSFFGVRYPQRGIASAVIETDIGKGDFDVTLSLLRLIRSIVNAPNPHEGLVISALHLVFTDVWSHFLGWRYRNTTRKYELASLLVSIFRAALSHPLRADGLTPTEAAKYLIETFFHSASPLSYRPVIEIITQSGPLLRKLVATHRRHDARVVITSLESTIDFIATLLRIATFLGSPANALPKNILAAPVQMVDTLFDLAVAAWSQESSKVAIIQLLCTWLEAMSSDVQPLSLAGLLKDAERSCQSLARLAGTNDSSDLQTSIWRLLGTIILTQPGCAAFCIGSIDAGSPGILPLAIGQIISFDSTTTYAPEALAAVLGYVQSVLMSPRAGKAIQSLRENSDFWRAVFDIATFLVPAPPTFTLSMHSEDFAARIRHYAYGVQAKANATALLAIEVALISVTWQEGETNAQSLVLSLFRNASTLEEAAMGAVHNSCNRDLHETEANKLSAYGLSLPALKTVRLPNEREFGRTYLYDGNATISAGDVTQATVNLALDMLNLNWSMIDADMALTQSFLGLCEVISSWTEGDGLAAKAAMRAATATAELVAEEVRGGDVMLAVQVERLNTLSVLLETALDPETETDVTATRQLATSIRAIIESQIFPPMVSMRQPELPSIHQPVLRIIFLFLRNLSSRQSAELSIDSTVEAATVFALEAADVVLDGIIRGKQGPSGDLAQIVGVLCEITRSSSSTVWLDKMVEHNLLSRSLEIVVRSRITNGLIPTHLSDILVLHLSLASHSLSAEKLAVSGILSAYSDNAIAIKAEQGRIVVTHPPAPNNVHSAWCGMLLVIKALLSNLPETDTPGFTRSDVLPFLRVCTAQLLRAMSWDGETPHSQAGINELEVTIDVFYGVAKAVGAVNGLLDDFAQPALGLLKSLRHVLSHPRLLSTLITPSTEEEHAALEKELTEVDAERDVKLLDFATTPVLAARTAALMRVARTVLVALVLLTRAWEVVRGEEAGVEVLLTLDDAPVSVSDDPVGVINDIYLLASSFLERLPPSNSAEEAKGARQVVSQLTESAGLLSTSQLIIRHSLQPGDQKPLEDDGMDVDGGGKRRVSLGKLGPEGRAAHTLRELAGDLRGMLPVDEDLVGGKGLLVWLRGVAEMAFGVD